MLKKLAIASLLSLVMVGQSALADTKIGVVNPDRILRESAAAYTAQQKLEKEFAGREKSLSISAKALKADIEKFQQRAPKMKNTERMAEERKLADRERSLQRRERELREDLNRRRNEELQSILMRSNEVIRDIARKGKYDLIVQEAVYVGPNVDKELLIRLLFWLRLCANSVRAAWSSSWWAPMKRWLSEVSEL